MGKFSREKRTRTYTEEYTVFLVPRWFKTLGWWLLSLGIVLFATMVIITFSAPRRSSLIPHLSIFLYIAICGFILLFTGLGIVNRCEVHC